MVPVLSAKESFRQKRSFTVFGVRHVHVGGQVFMFLEFFADHERLFPIGRWCICTSVIRVVTSHAHCTVGVHLTVDCFRFRLPGRFT